MFVQSGNKSIIPQKNEDVDVVTEQGASTVDDQDQKKTVLDDADFGGAEELDNDNETGGRIGW